MCSSKTYGLIIALITMVSFSVAYQDFSVKSLCPNSELQTTFNQLYSNRPAIQLYNNSESAALVHQIWTEDNLKEFQDCPFTIDSNIYSDTGRYERGIFLSLKKVNLRQKSNGDCIDYVRISFDGARTEKICGSFETDSEMGQKAFFNDGGGIIKVHIFVNKTIPLEANQRSIDIELVATAYQPCTSRQRLIKCNPKVDDHFCIAMDFLRDNIVNCPPPHSTDEPDRKKHYQSQTKGKAGIYVPWNLSIVLAFSAISIVFF